MTYITPTGIITQIASKAAANLPQSTQSALFTVTGGKVAIKIYGEVTTQIGAGVNNAKIVSNPTVGADVDLCATLDIDADVVGTMYSLNVAGNFSSAMVATTSGALVEQAAWAIVAAGTIDLSCSASKTGQTKWSCVWFPIDVGASLA